MATPTPDLEELLFDAQDCVTRWKAGRVEATAAAIDGGNILTMARGLTGHGDWLEWLAKVGLPPMTASRWMRLAALGLAAEEVVERGGVRAVLKETSHRTRTDRRPVSQRLAEAKARYDALKQPYYDALSELGRLQREVRREARGEAGEPPPARPRGPDGRFVRATPDDEAGQISPVVKFGSYETS